MWSGGIHASGSLPCESSVRSQRASARSVLARRFRPRSARVSATSARWGTAPARSSARTTKYQPERDVDLPARKAPHPPHDRLRVGRDPAGRDLTGIRVERVEGDLGAMDSYGLSGRRESSEDRRTCSRPSRRRCSRRRGPCHAYTTAIPMAVVCIVRVATLAAVEAGTGGPSDQPTGRLSPSPYRARG
jgi:hypothetical protein